MVKTLSDMKEENDDEKRQAYYAGGNNSHTGGGSGQEVLDPRDLMKRARDELGAATEGEWKANQPTGPGPSFTGAGHSLTSDAVTQGAPVPEKPQEHKITFWQNGFTVDDGPLRDTQDAQNAQFLAAINRGQMPAELAGPDGTAEGEVHLIDNSAEPCARATRTDREAAAARVGAQRAHPRPARAAQVQGAAAIGEALRRRGP
jgi:UBX domain-containing protein 1